MNEFEDMISKMKGTHSEVCKQVETQKQATAADHAARRQEGAEALTSRVSPLVNEALRAMDAQGIGYDHNEDANPYSNPTISLTCKGPKPRSDGSTYEVEGAAVEFSHDGRNLRVSIRRYPFDQKGPSEFTEGSEEDRVKGGIQAALETYFKAITPDRL